MIKMMMMMMMMVMMVVIMTIILMMMHQNSAPTSTLPIDRHQWCLIRDQPPLPTIWSAAYHQHDHHHHHHHPCLVCGVEKEMGGDLTYKGICGFVEPAPNADHLLVPTVVGKFPRL